MALLPRKIVNEEYEMSAYATESKKTILGIGFNDIADKAIVTGNELLKVQLNTVKKYGEVDGAE